MVSNRVLIGSLALALAVAAALLALVILSAPTDPSPPTGPTYSPALPAPPGTIVLGGKPYSYLTESLFGSRSWLNYSFGGVSFTFHLWCQIQMDTGYVCGDATEPTGVTYGYSFADGLPSATGAPPWETWIAPDGHEAVQYQDGGTVHLLIPLSD